jgi:hypothetical protein
VLLALHEGRIPTDAHDLIMFIGGPREFDRGDDVSGCRRVARGQPLRRDLGHADTEQDGSRDGGEHVDRCLSIEMDEGEECRKRGDADRDGGKIPPHVVASEELTPGSESGDASNDGEGGEEHGHGCPWHYCRSGGC